MNHKRRQQRFKPHDTTRNVVELTPQQAIDQMNEVAKQAERDVESYRKKLLTDFHRAVADIEKQATAHAELWQRVANDYETENERLRSVLMDIANCKQLGDAKGIAKLALETRG